MNENSESITSTDKDATEAWLEKASYGDEILLDLLTDREWLFAAGDPARGHDKEELQKHLDKINQAIALRKQELGIDPSQEP
jgi:hypothetical protein